MKLNIHFNEGNLRGPGVVAKNLVKGLSQMENIEVVTNAPPAADIELVGVLQQCPNMPRPTSTGILWGPNLVVVPSEADILFMHGQHHVVPSQWVKDLYESFDCVRPEQIHVWPVGVDTEEWSPARDVGTLSNKKKECLLYVKNRSEADLHYTKKMLDRYDIKYTVIKYGEYKEEDLKRACDNVDFAVLLTGTESQGLAYMQILSMDVPCYVFNSPTWKHKGHTCAASSVPYFDKRCGLITSSMDFEHFEHFTEGLELKKFSPREFILEKHSLRHSAESYLVLLKGSKFQ